MNHTNETKRQNYHTCPRYVAATEVARKKMPGYEFLNHRSTGWEIPYELALKYEHIYLCTILFLSKDAEGGIQHDYRAMFKLKEAIP